MRYWVQWDRMRNGWAVWDWVRGGWLTDCPASPWEHVIRDKAAALNRAAIRARRRGAAVPQATGSQAYASNQP